MGSSKKQTLGYRYLLDMHVILVHGPVDKCIRIQFDKRDAWTGDSSGGTINVSAENLFGGDKKEGGVSGSIDFETGLPDQAPNSYLAAAIGAVVPAFRGVAGFVLKQFYFGMNPYLKILNARLQRIHITTGGLTQWYDAKAAIDGTYSNPTTIFNEDFSNGIGDYEVITASDDFSIVNDGSNAYLRSSYVNPTVANTIRKYYRPTVFTKAQVRFKINSFGLDDTGQISFYGPSGLLFVFNAGRDTAIDALQRANVSLSDVPLNPGNPLGSSSLETGVWYVAYFVYDPATLIFQTTIKKEVGFAFGSLVVSQMETVRSLTLTGVTFPIGNSVFISTDKFSINQNGDMYWDYINVSGEGLNYDMNPAHILRECLTDPDWGMGYLATDIDDDAFEACADTLFDEGMGISILWDRQMPIEDFIKEIIRHINATLFVSRTTGKFVLKLIRKDYIEDDLITLGEDEIEKIEGFSYNSFGELVNSVTVNYWDSKTNSVGSVTEQDPALVQMQGVVIGTTIQYPGFTNKEIAQRAALRDLQTLSAPLRSCTAYANRAAKDLNIGDPFKLLWPDFADDYIVMRVIGLALGDGKSNKIRLTLTQDQFAFPDFGTISAPDSGWVDPGQAATPATVRLAIEAPYFELVQREGQSAVDDTLATTPAAGYVLASAVRPASAINASVYTDSGAGFEEAVIADFSPYATLTADVSKTATTFSITPGVDFDQVPINTHAQIGTEIVLIEAATLTTLTVGRGVLDTVPVTHLAGSGIMFWDVFGEVAQTQFLDGETVDVKICPITGQGALDLVDAPIDSVLMDQRAIRPYAPGNVTFNTTYWPEYHSSTNPLVTAWAHRDRKQQTSGDTVIFTDGNVGPEAGQTYRMRIYNEIDILVHTESGIAGTTYTYPLATEKTESGFFEGTVAGDPHFASVKTLLHFDGTDGSTTITDIKGKAYTCFGNAQLDTARKKYGTAGLLLDGTGDFIRQTLTNDIDFQPGAGDFTIEGWIYSTDLSVLRSICGNYHFDGAQTTGWLFYIDNSGRLTLVCRGAASELRIAVATAIGSVVINTFYYITVVKVGTTWNIYLDGVLLTSAVESGTVAYNANCKFQIGRWDNDSVTTRDFIGTIDDFRITKGVARYTANFTPPLNPHEDNLGSSGVARVNGKMRIELESVRDSLASFQRHEHTIYRYGYGLNYGLYYGGV